MKLTHPITGAAYTRNSDGNVTVAGRKSGTGIFDRKGRWVEGNLRIADPLLCLFVSDGFSLNAGGGSAVLNAAMNKTGSSE